MNSTHACEVVPVVLEKHPNADRLSIVKIFDGGYQCVVSTADWVGIDRAAYVPPDNVVPDLPEYSFLNGKLRITARRFRGVWSQGLLISAPLGAEIGDDVAKQLGITHYEPPMQKDAQQEEKYTPPFRAGSWRGRLYGWLYNVAHPKSKQFRGPNVIAPKYDVEAWRKYRHLLIDGEEVVITEKIHGANARYVCVNDVFYVGSRTNWKPDPRVNTSPWWWKLLDSRKREKSSLGWWWTAAANHPEIEKFCRFFPGEVLYGEVYGSVQDLKYGATKPSDVWFRAFDVYSKNGFWDYRFFEEMTACFNIPMAPQLYIGPYSRERMLHEAEGKSIVEGADNIREGCVVRPVKERSDALGNRVCLKLVSNAYHERGGK